MPLVNIRVPEGSLSQEKKERMIELVTDAVVEAEGYGKWTRVQEVIEFAKRMGWKKLGIANCIGFVDLARVLTGILESHGFEVVSVACKNGNIPKEEIWLSDDQLAVG